MLEGMVHFVRVVEAGSFSAAAQLAGMNPSSVTRRIDQLEAELGARLLVRSTRRLQLTPQGEQFYSQCVDILASVENARQSFRQPNADIQGSIAVTTFDTLGRETLVPLLPEFRAMYPETRVSLSLKNQLVDLYDSPFDLGIRYGKPTDSNLISRPLIKTSGVLLASPKYLVSRPAIKAPEDLHHHDCLTFYRPRQFAWWHFRNGSEYRKIKVVGSLSADGGTPLIMWCRRGQGIALVSRNFAEKEIREGSLSVVLPQWTAALSELDDASIYLVWTPAAGRKPIVRAMIDFLVQKLASDL